MRRRASRRRSARWRAILEAFVPTTPRSNARSTASRTSTTQRPRPSDRARPTSRSGANVRATVRGWRPTASARSVVDAWPCWTEMSTSARYTRLAGSPSPASLQTSARTSSASTRPEDAAGTVGLPTPPKEKGMPTVPRASSDHWATGIRRYLTPRAPVPTPATSRMLDATIAWSARPADDFDRPVCSATHRTGSPTSLRRSRSASRRMTSATRP